VASNLSRISGQVNALWAKTQGDRKESNKALKPTIRARRFSSERYRQALSTFHPILDSPANERIAV